MQCGVEIELVVGHAQAFRSQVPLKNVGDSHIIPREKCGTLAHNTRGNAGEARGAHSGARLDPTLMCSWHLFVVPLGVPSSPPESAVRTGQYPLAPLSALAVRVFSQGTLATRSRILVGVLSGASACILSSNTAHSRGFSGWQAGSLSRGPICRASRARATWAR